MMPSGFSHHTTAGRGRRPTRGKRIKLAKCFDTLTKADRNRLALWKSNVRYNTSSLTCFLRDVKNKVRVVVAEGASRPILLVSTSLDLSPTQILEIYAARFSIEIAIRELKTTLRFG